MGMDGDEHTCCRHEISHPTPTGNFGEVEFHFTGFSLENCFLPPFETVKQQAILILLEAPPLVKILRMMKEQRGMDMDKRSWTAAKRRIFWESLIMVTTTYRDTAPHMELKRTGRETGGSCTVLMNDSQGRGPHGTIKVKKFPLRELNLMHMKVSVDLDMDTARTNYENRLGRADHSPTRRLAVSDFMESSPPSSSSPNRSPSNKVVGSGHSIFLSCAVLRDSNSIDDTGTDPFAVVSIPVVALLYDSREKDTQLF
ncbi:hypothetical protein SAY87_028933 [Trapa incisa]|uniref:Uncharacterized protein n=1 Tax=Trapa incisa TaxID=236973 RepID=A0AAN7QP78_9MYRT|nr:hypothetical protein SAY87_028933 [Trapa incisa]